MKVRIAIILEGEGQLVDVAGDGPSVPWSEIVASALAIFDSEPEEIEGKTLTVRCMTLDVPASIDLTPEECFRIYHERAKENVA